MSREARFQGFWDFLAHFEVEGVEFFGAGMCDRTAGSYHVLSVSVVPSVSVESAMEVSDPESRTVITVAFIFQLVKKSSEWKNCALPLEFSRCSLVAFSELQPMLVLLSVLNAV